MRVDRPKRVVARILALLVPALLIAAAGINHPARADSNAGGIDWGVNANGWQVVVYNDSDTKLEWEGTAITDNVATISHQIEPHSQGSVSGVKSAFSGPANMNFGYYPEDDSCCAHLVIINSDFRGNVSVDCEPARACTVAQQERSKPIVVRIGK